MLLRISYVVLLATIAWPHAYGCVRGNVQERARRSVDGSNLRQITQATFIHADDHQGKFPAASDIWDYAGILAASTGLNDARMWQSKLDPASDANSDTLTTVLLPPEPDRPRQFDSHFRNAKPSVAVVLSGLNLNAPETTPIAWTRGLQPNGTWANHSPYGTRGGWIAFKGGNIAFFHTLEDDDGQLTRFDGKGKTANILEALPPGARIGEYLPTSDEQTEWSKITDQRIKRERWQRYFQPEVIILLIVWMPFTILAIYRRIKKRDNVAKAFLTPLILSGVILFLMSITCF